jgi:hypothetical protein
MKTEKWIEAEALRAFAHAKLADSIPTYRARSNVVRLYVALCMRYFRWGWKAGEKIETSKTRWAIRKDCEGPNASITYSGAVGGKNFYDRLAAMRVAGLVNQFEDGEPISFFIPDNAVSVKTADEIAQINRAATRKKQKKRDQRLAQLQRQHEKKTSPTPALAES